MPETPIEEIIGLELERTADLDKEIDVLIQINKRIEGLENRGKRHLDRGKLGLYKVVQVEIDTLTSLRAQMRAHWKVKGVDLEEEAERKIVSSYEIRQTTRTDREDSEDEESEEEWELEPDGSDSEEEEEEEERDEEDVFAILSELEEV